MNHVFDEARQTRFMQVFFMHLWSPRDAIVRVWTVPVGTGRHLRLLWVVLAVVKPTQARDVALVSLGSALLDHSPSRLAYRQVGWDCDPVQCTPSKRPTKAISQTTIGFTTSGTIQSNPRPLPVPSGTIHMHRTTLRELHKCTRKTCMSRVWRASSKTLLMQVFIFS